MCGRRRRREGRRAQSREVQRNVVHLPNLGLRVKGIPGASGVQSHWTDTGSSPLSAAAVEDRVWQGKGAWRRADCC